MNDGLRVMYNTNSQTKFKYSMLNLSSCDYSDSYILVNPIQDGPFWASHECRGKKVPLTKIYHTYHTMMELRTVIPYLKSIT